MAVKKKIKKKIASTLGIGSKNKVGKIRHRIRKGLTDVAKDTVSAGGKVIKRGATGVKKTATAYKKGVTSTVKAGKKVGKTIVARAKHVATTPLSELRKEKAKKKAKKK